ncbi:MAG: hypothetical protein ACLFPL_02620 [Candidatus Nanoarchaeia archaeon]
MTGLYQHPDVVLADDANKAYLVAEQLYQLRQKPTIMRIPSNRKGSIKEAISTRGGRDIFFLGFKTKTPFGWASGWERDYDFGPNEFTSSPIMYFEDSEYLGSLPRRFNSFLGERIEFSNELKQSLERLEDRIGKPQNWWNFGGDRTAHICVQDEVNQIFREVKNQLGNERIIIPHRRHPKVA